MSEADPSEVSVVVEQDGLSVEKSYEPDDFPVPAIAFVIQSNRDERVHVRLSDGVPENVNPSDIGFHPKYGAEFWDVADDRIVFERDFEAGEEYTTVYGLRSETDDIEQYLSEPEFDEVDPPLEDTMEAVSEVMDEEEKAEDGDIALDMQDPVDGDPAAVTDNEGEGASPDDLEGAIPEADTGLDAEPTEAVSESESGASGADRSGTGSTGEISPANVAEALAREIREGSVSEPAMETLREELEPRGSSVDARIADLQTDVADLRAYTDALEEFLDEEGDAQEILDNLDTRLEQVENHLADVDDRTERNTDRIGEVDADLASLDEEVNDIAETVDSVSSDVTAVDGRVDKVDGRVDDVFETVDSVSSDVTDVDNRVDEVDDQVGDVDNRVDDVQNQIETVREEIGEDIDDRVGDLEDRLDDIQDDLDQLDQMRQQLSSVFGAQPGGRPGDTDDSDGDPDEE